MSKTLHRNLEAKLAALEGPEWDSSDEEIVEPKATQKIAKKKSIDKKPTSQKQLKRKETEDSKVIYLGHIPSAFEESQLLKFLSQFGKVTNIKLSRSRRTGNPRGYAFVEFADYDVASIVADTMSGYFLMGERRLVCHIVPQDKIHPELFRGSKENLARSQAGKTAADHLKVLHDSERKKVNAVKSVDQMKKITKRLLNREKKKREQLKALGIDYDFPGYAASVTQNKDDTKKKRKVSVDETEESEAVKTTPKKSKKTKQNPKKSGKKRSGSEDQMESTEVAATSTPAKNIKLAKAKTEKKKKKPKSSKKRRQSVE